jgi:hypothetical protein
MPDETMMHSLAAHNRLPALAEDIRRAHAGVRKAMRAGTEYAIEAGRALTEAKSLLKHGQWLPWLRRHRKLPERTAQLYMHIASLVDDHGLKSATVADLGVRFLGKMKQVHVIISPGYDPFFHCDGEGKRQWRLFMLCGMHPSHVEWLLQKQFRTPDEWLGEGGTRCRRRWGYRRPEMGPPFLKAWAAFQEEHAAETLADVEAALKRFHAIFGRDRATEQQGGFLLAGLLVTDLPINDKSINDADTEIITHIVRRLVDSRWEDPFLHEAGSWRAPQKPADGMSPPFPVDLMRERMDRCLVLNIGVEPYEGEPDQMRWLEMKPKGSSRRTVIFRPVIRSPGERTIH